MIEELVAAGFLATVPITSDVTDLGQHLSWVAIQGADDSFAEGIERFRLGKFNAANGEVPSLGFSDDSIFFGILVENKTGIRRFVLELGYPLLDYVDFYTQNGDGLEIRASGGDKRPFYRRYRSHRTINFQFTSQKNSHSLIILKVRSQGALQLPLTFRIIRL